MSLTVVVALQEKVGTMALLEQLSAIHHAIAKRFVQRNEFRGASFHSRLSRQLMEFVERDEEYKEFEPARVVRPYERPKGKRRCHTASR